MELLNKSYYASLPVVLTDIYPVQYGEEQCAPSHSYGPCVRSNYLLHYIYSGEGIFKVGSSEYHLHSGQMFLIQPSQLTYYRADHDNPWLYRWIEFNGSLAYKILRSADLSAHMPIFNDDENQSAGKALLKIVQSGNMRYEKLVGLMWDFFAAMNGQYETGVQNAAQDYIKKAESFIRINLHKKITVSDVAEYIGINRSYLSRLFEQYKNISPQQYIISTKMRAAAQYLKNTNISITEAAQSVGYFDTHVFNKTFKKQFGKAPSAWRKEYN